jgi:hypothetical protein
MKIAKKNALILAPSMLTADDLAIIEGGSESPGGEPHVQYGEDGTRQESVTGEGFLQYCETLPDGTQRTSLAVTPTDGPAIHETSGF